MHSIFFGLRQYCSACHQWHFSPRNVLCVFQASTEKTISARSQKEWKEIDKNPFFFSGELKAMKTILCSIFDRISISMATWGRSGCSGQLPHRERDLQWKGHKPTNKPYSILSNNHATHYPHWHHQDSHTDRGIYRHKETENNKKFPFTSFFPPFCFKACNSLLCPRVN